MIQKAIVESIENNYQVKVRIPKYDKSYDDGTSYNDLSTSIICAYPGTQVSYAKGDVVLVGFENDELGKPVVLGLLYAERDNGAEVKVDGLSDTIEKVETAIQTINNKSNYLHVKYSNDGGNTFTSLYDYSENELVGESYCRYDIPINKLSSFIAWNITDKNLNVAIDNFKYDIIVTTSLGDKLLSSESYVALPDTYKYSDSISMSYMITPKDGVDINDYIISLYTDKDPIGTTEGDFIGMYYSNSSIPPMVPNDYAWLSIKTRIQKFIDEAFNSLLERVQTNERYLFGISREDTTNTNTGINSSLEVSKDRLDLNKKSVIQLTKFISADTEKNSLWFNNIEFKVTDSGDLVIS